MIGALENSWRTSAHTLLRKTCSDSKGQSFQHHWSRDQKLWIPDKQKNPKTNGWNLKKAPWKRRNIYKPPIFGFQPLVFGGCMSVGFGFLKLLTIFLLLLVLALLQNPQVANCDVSSRQIQGVFTNGLINHNNPSKADSIWYNPSTRINKIMQAERNLFVRSHRSLFYLLDLLVDWLDKFNSFQTSSNKRWSIISGK